MTSISICSCSVKAKTEIASHDRTTAFERQLKNVSAFPATEPTPNVENNRPTADDGRRPYARPRSSAERRKFHSRKYSVRAKFTSRPRQQRRLLSSSSSRDGPRTTGETTAPRRSRRITIADFRVKTRRNPTRFTRPRNFTARPTPSPHIRTVRGAVVPPTRQ